MVGGLVGEVVPEHSCLVFCPTKRNCETLAELICRILPKELTKVSTFFFSVHSFYWEFVWDIQHVITSHWHSKFCDLWIYRFEWLINALSTVPCLKRGLGLCALFWEESSHMVLHIITLVGLALYPFSFVFAHFYSQSFCNEIWYHFPKSHGIKTVCIIIFFFVLCIFMRIIHMMTKGE